MLEYKVELGGKTFYGQANASKWWWLSAGLEGWYDSPPPRWQAEATPGQNGAFYPSDLFLDARVMTFTGAVRSESAEQAESEVNLWATSLVNRRDLTLKVTDSSGVKTARVFVSGQILVTRLDATASKFSIPLTAPDPIKYGLPKSSRVASEVSYTDGLHYATSNGDVGDKSTGLDYGTPSGSVAVGTIQATNEGTVPVLPSFKVHGPIGLGFVITSGDKVITTNLSLNASDELLLSPYAGGCALLNGVTNVTSQFFSLEWASIPAGGQRGFYFEPATSQLGTSCEVIYRDGWI